MIEVAEESDPAQVLEASVDVLGGAVGGGHVEVRKNLVVPLQRGPTGCASTGSSLGTPARIERRSLYIATLPSRWGCP